MNIEKNAAYLIIDWGTTNFRAFCLDKDDILLDSITLSQGLMQVKDNAFAETLKTILKNWLPSFVHLPIYMAGMVGSAKGWHDVAYAQTPAASADLHANAYTFELPWSPKATIFPGVSHKYEPNEGDLYKYDVMRGEEIQVFGLANITRRANVNAILPGTHSKHIQYENDKIVCLSTYMTGELYAMLSQYSILAKGLPESSNFCSESFKRGIAEATTGELTNCLFLARTHLLFAQLKQEQVKDYISGMLISYELKNLVRQPVYIVGAPQLSKKYLLACQMLSIKAELVDGDECFLKGMIELIKRTK